MDGSRVFNTGRVQIGKEYRPPVRVDMDADAVRLQGALLKQPSGMPLGEKVAVWVCLACLVAVVAMDRAGWIQ